MNRGPGFVRLAGDRDRHIIVETKGFDPLEEVKTSAAVRWVNAVNAEGSYGRWGHAVAKKVPDVDAIIEGALEVIVL